MKKILCSVLLLLVFICCNNQNCTDINNKKFNSYSEAKQYVETFDFQLSEEEDVQRSSWMRKANYYSCDGLEGYFTYETKNGKKFIYRNLPIEVWQGFKYSNSPGRFYNENIKGRFLLILDKG
ncbi:KTSC domain-containing protein [Flavobacterium sp. GNP002]